MKTETTKQSECKRPEPRVQDRMMNASPKFQAPSSKPEERRPNSMTRKILPALLVLLSFGIWHLALGTSGAATVTGDLTDVSIAALQTKLTFTPTNAVVVNSHGLGIGPAKTIEATNGTFSIVLDAGPYTVCTPLLRGRDCFQIEVPTGTSSYNITNLITSGALTVTYVGNRLQYEEAGADVGYLQFE